MFDVVSVDTLHIREICEDTLLNFVCYDTEPKDFTRTAEVATTNSTLYRHRNNLLFIYLCKIKSHGAAACLLDPFLSVIS